MWLMCGQFLCRLQSIAAHRDHFVRHLSVGPSVRPSVCLSVCLSGSHTFLVVTHSYVSQATIAFLRMLPLCSLAKNSVELGIVIKLGIHVAHDERMYPINCLGPTSSSQWTNVEKILWAQLRWSSWVYFDQPRYTWSMPYWVNMEITFSEQDSKTLNVFFSDMAKLLLMWKG